MKIKLPKIYRPVTRMKNGKVYRSPYYGCNLPLWAIKANRGKRWFNTRETVKEAAEAEVKNFLRQANAQIQNTTFKEAYLDKAIETYLISKQGLAKSSFKKYRQTVEEFRDFVIRELGYMPRIENIDRPFIEKYLGWLLQKENPLSEETRDDKRNILTNLFGYAKSVHWISENPVSKIPRLHDDSYTPDVGEPYSKAEVEMILAYLKKEQNPWRQNKCYYQIMATIFFAGLRISEATHLLKEDIVLPYRICVRSKDIAGSHYKTKTKKAWYPVMNRELSVILSDWLRQVKGNPSPLLFPNTRGKPIKNDLILGEIKKILRKLNIPEDKVKRALHRGRHAYAKHARESGIPRDIVQDNLGHESDIMTKRYENLDDGYKSKELDALSYRQKGRKKV